MQPDILSAFVFRSKAEPRVQATVFLMILGALVAARYFNTA